jgi:CHASE1-domain containing sensor protein
MRRRFLLGLAAVATVAVGSVLGALIVRAHETRAFERQQRELALRAAHQAEAVAALSVGQLASAAAFYQAEHTEGALSQHEFDVMAESLANTGVLAGTAFVRFVPASERIGFELERDAPIAERGTLGRLDSAGERPFYFPLAFVETDVDVDIQSPIGYDIGSDVVRRPYLLRARDSGEPTATRVIRLLVGGTGINVFRPVYADGEPTATVAQRRAALVGFATGAFRVPDLAGAATGLSPTTWTPSCWRAAGPWPAPPWISTTRRQRRSGSPIASGCSSSATPTGPASRCRS